MSMQIEDNLREEESQIYQDIRLFRGVAATLGVLVLISMNFFHFVEGWSWLDALYFTVITMATVGYGDLVPVHTLGKIGAMILVIVGMGLFAMFASLLIKRQTQIREERRRER